MTTKKAIKTDDGFEFHINEIVFDYDDYKLWLELVLESIELLREKIPSEYKKDFSSWTIHHRKYNQNNPLDYNYVLFSSVKGNFEAYRELEEGCYSKLKIRVVTE